MVLTRIQHVEIANVTFVLPYGHVRKKTDNSSPGISVFLPKSAGVGRIFYEREKRKPHCEAEEGRREARDVVHRKLESYQHVQCTQAEDR